MYRVSYWLDLQTKIGRPAFFSQRSPVHNWIINSAANSEIIWRRNETIQRRSSDSKPVNIYPNTKTCLESSSSVFIPWTEQMQRLPVRVNILTVHTPVQYLMPYYTCTGYRAYKVHYACISVDSASVRTTKSTIQLQNALCNNAQRPTFFEVRSFQSRWIKRQRVDTAACCTCVERGAQHVCLWYFANS